MSSVFYFLWSSEVSSSEAKHADRVVAIGDGVASVAGLEKAKSGEMVLFASGDRGKVFNLEKQLVCIVLFGLGRIATQGQLALRTVSFVSVKAGSFLLGRVVGGVGNSIGGLGSEVRPEDISDKGVGSACLYSWRFSIVTQ